LDQRGKCRTGRQPVVASHGPHFGEERPISGYRGSGTIFFSHCNLYCIFCQNDDISHGGTGHETSSEELAEIMLLLQNQGCHNINFVTPSHVIHPILEALSSAIKMGLRIPLVYNSGGYDSLDSIRLLRDVVDIYMPDLKFLSSNAAAPWTIAPDYPEVARQSILAMQDSVGDLKMDSKGVAQSGLLVRHLVLPGCVGDSKAVLRFLAQKVSRKVYVNIMSQYRPCYQAVQHTTLNRRPSLSEYREVVREAAELGLVRAEFQSTFFQ